MSTPHFRPNVRKSQLDPFEEAMQDESETRTPLRIQLYFLWLVTAFVAVMSLAANLYLLWRACP